MNKFKIELFLPNSEVTSRVIESSMSLTEMDAAVANSLDNGKFISADESEGTILSVRCSLVEKYRVTIIK